MASSQSELAQKMDRVDSLISALEGCTDPAVRESAHELVCTLMEFHADAIGRILEKVSESTSTDPGLIETMAQDPLVHGVLLLHGLHPLDTEARVHQALEKVRPSLRSHRGDVELMELDENRVKLRLIGTCNGCPSSASTFRNLLESAIQEMVPEIESIEVDGMVSSKGAAS